MKLSSNFSLFLFVFLIHADNAFSLTDYEIKKICKKERRELICIKNFREKRSDLQKGDLIEIPVIPYKR